MTSLLSIPSILKKNPKRSIHLSLLEEPVKPLALTDNCKVPFCKRSFANFRKCMRCNFRQLADVRRYSVLNTTDVELAVR